MTDTPETVMARAMDRESERSLETHKRFDTTDLAKVSHVALRAAGYAVVPMEPTEKMYDAMNIHGTPGVPAVMKSRWQSAIAAAQEDQP